MDHTTITSSQVEDLIAWLQTHVDIDDEDARELASKMLAHAIFIVTTRPPS